MERTPKKALRRLAQVSGLVALGLVAYFARGYELPRPSTLAEFFGEWKDDPALAPHLPLLYTGFVAVCAASTFPRALVILVATATFGAVRAILYTSLGGTLGAGTAFLIARYVARDYVLARLPERWLGWQEKVSANAFWFIFVLRAIPFSPMSSPHYASGLTRMSVVPFLSGTFLGFSVSTLFYVFFSQTLIDLYKRFFDVPYIVPLLIGIQAAAVACAVLGYRIYKKRRKDLARLFPDVLPDEEAPDPATPPTPR